MAQYIQDSKGRLAGSIGDGKTTIPTPSDLPASTAGAPADPSPGHLDAVYDAYKNATASTGAQEADGVVRWRTADGMLHREDGPAVETPDGTLSWFHDGALHRDGGPASTRPDGYEIWAQHGAPHRQDGPAVTYPDGTREWFIHGQRHRDGGPAIESADGSTTWYQHGVRHRDDGPAETTADGTRIWYHHGRIHREDGPAIERTDGISEWYQHGRPTSAPDPAPRPAYPDTIPAPDLIASPTIAHPPGKAHLVENHRDDHIWFCATEEEARDLAARLMAHDPNLSGWLGIE